MCDNKHNILLSNIADLTSFYYSLILIKGKIETDFDIKCNSENITFEVKNNENISLSKSVVRNNQFKYIIELNKGENEVRLTYCCSSLIIKLFYKPKVTNFCVIPLYIICKNHDGTFDSPDNKDNSIDAACKKIALGTKLIQCLIAEKFYENGFNRKTFQLQSEVFNNVADCRIFHSNLDVNVVRKMKQDELWYTFGRELMTSEYANETYKYLAFISCTRYRGDKFNDTVTTHDDIVSITEAHAALGGGGLAIFGSSCLHTWPTYLNEIVSCFEDDTIVDKTQLMDDSCYRGTYGGCFATTLGAVCHELCHTFDLGHTSEGIMARGFDNINKEFTLSSSKSHSKVKKILSPSEQHCIVDFTPNIKINVSENVLDSKKIKLNPHPVNKNKTVRKDGIYWTRNGLILLYNHKWFNEMNNDIHSLDFKDNLVTSSAGISIIEIHNEVTGMVLEWFEFSNTLIKSFEININCLLKENDNQTLLLIVEDIVGNIMKCKI